jgi:hypothetical protein
MTEKNVTPRKGRGKVAAQLAADELTTERVRAILSDPNTGERVTLKLTGLLNTLGGATDAGVLETPDFYAHTFAHGSAALRAGVVPRFEVKEARAAVEQIAALAERHEPQAFKVARRCREIYADWLGRKKGRKYADGAHFFVEHVDAVLEGGEDGLMPNPDSKYFVPLFVEAWNDRGPRDRHVRKLFDLIKRVDEGADLNALYDKDKRQEAARQEALRAASLAKPEPKDRLSDEWRYWKIRHLGAGLQGGDAEAWGEFWCYLDAFKDAALSADVYTATAYAAARQMLADLLIFWQKSAIVKRPTQAGKDARLIRRLSAVLADPKREDEHRAILVTLNDLSNKTGVSDLHPEIFPTLSRAVIRAAREQARGRSEAARRMARYLRGLEMLAGE